LYSAIKSEDTEALISRPTLKCPELQLCSELTIKFEFVCLLRYCIIKLTRLILSLNKTGINVELFRNIYAAGKPLLHMKIVTSASSRLSYRI